MAVGTRLRRTPRLSVSMDDRSSDSSEAQERIADLERRVSELTATLNEERRALRGSRVPDYTFDTLEGTVLLSGLFSGRDRLLAIHNMGQGCRYCTLWADGINGVLPHLESAMAVVLLSKDKPDVQRHFANSRGWRFRLASHGGGAYIREQTTCQGIDNMPGAVLYELRDGAVWRKSAVVFGPGDIFCPTWNFLAMAGIPAEEWTPQFNYWQRPATLDDGGLNILE